MRYEGKECKSFLNKCVKLINGVNKYNVESVLLVQLYIDSKHIEPVIMSKPLDIDIFSYLKTIFSDNEIYMRSLEYLDYSKIKKKIDALFYVPIIFATQTAIPLMKIEQKDLSNIHLLLPSKYSNDGSYTDSYFIISDLFKDFVKDKIITAVDDELNMYDENGLKYDTSAFIFENNINPSFETRFVNTTSPKHLLPLHIQSDSNIFINKHIRSLLIKLNAAFINRELDTFITQSSDIGIIDNSQLDIDKLMKKVKETAIFDLKSPNTDTIITTYSELFKVNPKEVLFVKKELSKKNIYAGLGIKTKDYILYLFYRYFDIDWSHDTNE